MVVVHRKCDGVAYQNYKNSRTTGSVETRSVIPPRDCCTVDLPPWESSKFTCTYSHQGGETRKKEADHFLLVQVIRISFVSVAKCYRLTRKGRNCWQSEQIVSCWSTKEISKLCTYSFDRNLKKCIIVFTKFLFFFDMSDNTVFSSKIFSLASLSANTLQWMRRPNKKLSSSPTCLIKFTLYFLGKVSWAWVQDETVSCASVIITFCCAMCLIMYAMIPGSQYSCIIGKNYVQCSVKKNKVSVQYVDICINQKAGASRMDALCTVLLVDWRRWGLRLVKMTESD